MNKFFKSFVYAFSGIVTAFSEQPNVRIHAAASLLVIALGLYFRITPVEWSILVLAISLVVALELVNTAMEYLVDLISPSKNKVAGRIKDIAAGAVLVAAIGSLIVGILIFNKYISRLV